MASPTDQPLGRTIVTTAARPDLIDTAADWIWNAFWKKNGFSYDDIRALVVTSDAVIGPSQCLVLLVDGVPVGTAGLIHNDLSSRPELTPWLAAMYVRPEARGCGHALALIHAVETAAVTAGFTRLWLYTFTAEGLYRKAGWQTVEPIEENGAPATLMRREL